MRVLNPWLAELVEYGGGVETSASRVLSRDNAKRTADWRTLVRDLNDAVLADDAAKAGELMLRLRRVGCRCVFSLAD